MAELEDKIKSYVIHNITSHFGKAGVDFEVRIKSILTSLGQSDIVWSNVNFTNSIEEILNEGDKQYGYQLLSEELDSLLSKLSDFIRKTRDNLMRIKVRNIIISEAHNVHLVKRFITRKLLFVDDFHWQMFIKWRYNEKESRTETVT